eukprot:765109-Hanusia_phi.AAC.4
MLPRINNICWCVIDDETPALDAERGRRPCSAVQRASEVACKGEHLRCTLDGKMAAEALKGIQAAAVEVRYD